MSENAAQPTDHPAGRESGAPDVPGRRSFITVLVGVGTAAVGALLSVPLMSLFLFPLLRKTTEVAWSDAGDWVGNKQQFLCPCHGSVFVEDGAKVAGPSPRSLDYLDSIDENG